MNELETRLRDLLEAAAPESPATDGLVAGAHRYAVRARRVRVLTTVVVAAVVVGVVGAASSALFHDRAAVPARPLERITCDDEGRATVTRPPQGVLHLSETVDQVLVCADRSDRSAWPGNLPDDEPVSSRGALDYLQFEPKAATEKCAARRTGPAYRMLLQGWDGALRAYANTALACNGWPALNRYLVALGDQQSARGVRQLADPFPTCPSVLHQQLRPASDAPPQLRRGTVLTDATLCGHPLADPDAPASSDGRMVRRVVLGASDLAVLNEQLAVTGSHKQVLQGCATPIRFLVVIQGRTADGEQLSIAQACEEGPWARVNWAADDIIEIGPAFQAVVNRLLT